jgi:hypothetical protein
MSYAGENIVRIRQAWIASTNETETKPVCIILDTAVSAKDVLVDLYIEEGVLVGAKVYQWPGTKETMLDMGRTS